MSSDEDSSSVEQDVYQALSKMFLHLDDCDRHFFGEFGLSSRQYWALHYLGEDKSLSMVDLSRLLLTDKSNITAIIDRLEAAGYVKRTLATYDRRVYLITLTPTGQAKRDIVYAQHKARIQDLIGGQDREALVQLLHFLTPIQHQLEAYLERVAHVPTIVP